MTPGVTVNQSMDERIKEFRNDPEKMNVTTKFVNEVVEKAKDEALRRMKDREGVQQPKFDGGPMKKPNARFCGEFASRMCPPRKNQRRIRKKQRLL